MKLGHLFKVVHHQSFFPNGIISLRQHSQYNSRSLHPRRFCSSNFLSCVNYYIEHMVSFTTLALSNISAIQRYLGLVKCLSSKNTVLSISIGLCTVGPIILHGYSM